MLASLIDTASVFPTRLVLVILGERITEQSV